MSTESPASTIDDDLPKHLNRIADRGGRILCLTCRRYVTVGPDGTEYGHQRRGRGANDPLPEECDGRCPHRPESVEPTGGPRGGPGYNPLRDDEGNFAGSEVSSRAN